MLAVYIIHRHRIVNRVERLSGLKRNKNEREPLIVLVVAE